LQLAEFFSLWKCEFEFATDVGAAAHKIQRVTGQKWDAIVLDIDCADTQISRRGELVEQARRLKGLPIVVLLPSSWGLDEERWETPGIVVVGKPLKQRLLGTSLANTLGLVRAPTPVEPDSRSLVAATRLPRAGYRLLVVEDNAMNQIVMVSMLESLGYTNVAVVNDGRAAIEALGRSDYDAALMDCQMPEMDGYEATRIIRDCRSPVRNHSIPVIAITAHAIAGDRARCLRAGMDDYISKPVLTRVLENVLEGAIGKAAKPGIPETEEERTEAGTAPLFDRVELLDRLNNNAELATRIARMFVRDIPGQLVALSEAIRNADADRVQFAAHSLKGAAAAISGSIVWRAASTMESLSAAGDLATAEAMLPQLVRQTEILRNEVEQFCQLPSQGE
jgi:CheY-like chemotaxis protein